MKRLLTALLILPAPAAAQHLQCGPTEAVRQFLQERYREGRRLALLLPDGAQIIEVYTATKGRTWTLLVTGAEGQSCMVKNGTGFSVVADHLPADGAPG